jgi:RNA polymerase sigma-70 factor (ECF subfamily)
MTTLVGRRDAEAAERELVAALRRGEEDAFVELVDRFGASMLRAARLRVPSAAVAEEVVQETWLRVLRGVSRFEGRSSLRTWIFVILGNCARRRAQLEGRSIPFAALGPAGAEATVAAEHFFPADHPLWPRCWTTLVDGWPDLPDERLLSHELLRVVRDALAALPRTQREVMVLRDAEGWSGEEVSSFLDLTPENQRVLLHRARARVRAAIAAYVQEGRVAG